MLPAIKAPAKDKSWGTPQVIRLSAKQFLGYSPSVGVIGNMVVGIENGDGNANVRFHQKVGAYSGILN